MAKDAEAKVPKRKDLVLAHSRTPDGNGVNVLRSREDRVELGTMRPLEEGKPLVGEVVKLTRRKESPVLFDAETIVEAPEQKEGDRPSAAARSGPPQVSSPEYRSNWELVYKRRSQGKLLN